MKLIEVTLNYRKEFEKLIASSKLVHSTTDARAKRIIKDGFRAGSYFTVDEAGWNSEVELVVDGSSVLGSIYPDPEHLLDAPEIKALNLKSISFQTVTKKIPKEELFRIFMELIKSEGIRDASGFWVYCEAKIPASKVRKI